MTDLFLRNVIKQVLEQSEIDEFGLHEWGGDGDELAEIREKAIGRIYKLVGARQTCFGCGHWLNECDCGMTEIMDT